MTKVCSWYCITNVGTLVSDTRWSANFVSRVLFISTPNSKNQEYTWSGVQCIFNERVCNFLLVLKTTVFWIGKTFYLQELVVPSWKLRGFLSPEHGAYVGCGRTNGVQYGRQLRIYWTIIRGKTTRGCPPAWFLRKLLKNPDRKNRLCHEILTNVLESLIAMTTAIGK